MIRVGADCIGCENVLDTDMNTRTCPHMGQDGCKQKRQKRTERHKYPKPMPEPVVYYGRSDSQYPETIRMSFADGHTEIYDRRVIQPQPILYVPCGRRGKR